jgi:imidazolonepropionase-like amidohydrolase
MIRFAVAAAVAVVTPAAAQTVVVTADRMLDVTSGRTVERPAVVIVDGRIATVGTQGSIAIPTGATRIDLVGKTILPGLIDMHVHLSSTPLIGGYRRFQYTDAFWTAIAVANARATLEAGFTTVRNLGADGYADVAVRQGVDGGFFPGPRVVAATDSFGATGGHCGGTNLLPPRFAGETERGINGAEAVRAKVRLNRKYGADVIKVCATGGVFSANTEPGAQQMTEAELRAAADEAHMLNMKVAAHAHGTEGIKAAIRAGIDTIEHVSFIDDEGVALAKQRGTWLGFDVYNTEYTLAEGEKNGVLRENIDKERQVGTVQRDNFRRAARAGAKMIFSTDAGIYPHGHNAKQFAVMVRLGMTPIEAIRSATANAADALGRKGQVGVIAPGAWGDMIAVDGDPLADVSTLERPAAVIKGGTRVR